jgi:hypothetical protein
VCSGTNGRNTTARSIAQALGGIRNGNGYLCRCPVATHGKGRGDRNPSLSIADGDDGKLLVRCFAGCDPCDVLAALRSRGLLDARCPNGGTKPNGAKAAKPVRTFTYEYRDPVSGEARYRKIRREYSDGSKRFFFEPKGRSGSLPLLYGGERLADLTEGQPVWIVEGEKKVEALRAFGAIAVSGDTGADSKWLPEHARLLCGHPVIFWPDSDAPGEGYFARAAAAISAENPSAVLRVVRPFPMAAKGEKGRDVCDWTGSAKQFAALVASAKPYEPEAAKPGRGADCPLPLFPPLPPSEPFPIVALGATLSRAAKAIASKVQVPPAMAAQSVLAAASLAACAHADVMLPYGQARPLSLFFATVAASGDRKSTSDREALWPLRKREEFLREQHIEEMKDWKHACAAWVAEKRKIEGDKKIDFQERKNRLVLLGDEPIKPLSAFLTTGDMTIEGLVKNWPDAHAALGLFTAEGGMFTAGHGMNDDNRLKTAAMLSELWDGLPVKRIRALDGVTILPGRRLAMHVMIQPDAAESFLSNPMLRDQGLLSRVLIARPESLAGSRLYQEPRPEDTAAIRAYGARVLSILEAELALMPGKRNELDPRALPIAPEAATIWRDFHDHIETQCGANSPLAFLRDFAAKAAEHAARIAGVLTIVEDLHANEIGVEAMRNAITLADWYVSEACRLQEAGRSDPRLRRAALLLEWIQSQPGGKATISRILTHGPNALRTKAVAEDALAILLDHRWIIEASRRPRIVQVIGETCE